MRAHQVAVRLTLPLAVQSPESLAFDEPKKTAPEGAV